MPDGPAIAGGRLRVSSGSYTTTAGLTRASLPVILWSPSVRPQIVVISDPA